MAEPGTTPRPPRTGLVRVHPDTGEETPTRYRGPTVREYFGADLDAALDAWGRLDSRPAARESALRAIAALEAAEGARTHEVYVPSGNATVVVVFDVDPSGPAATITATDVDHRTRIPGSTPAGLGWRTPLGSGRASSATAARPATRPSSSRSPKAPAAKKPAAPTMVPCPTCFELVPRHGECRCGWRPSDG